MYILCRLNYNYVFLRGGGKNILKIRDTPSPLTDASGA